MLELWGRVTVLKGNPCEQEWNSGVLDTTEKPMIKEDSFIHINAMWFLSPWTLSYIPLTVFHLCFLLQTPFSCSVATDKTTDRAACGEEAHDVTVQSVTMRKAPHLVCCAASIPLVYLVCSSHLTGQGAELLSEPEMGVTWKAFLSGPVHFFKRCPSL